MRLAYTLLAYALAPLLVANWLVRGWRERAYWADLSERFGFGPASAAPSLWIHAVSAGEVQASAPLVARLRELRPDLGLLVTTATPAGRARAIALYPMAVVRYSPIDLPGSVSRFFARLHPVAGVVLETELWPALYGAAAARAIPICLASARLSARSVGRYRRVAGFARTVLTGVSVAAQSEDDAARFVAIGADPSRVTVTGNLKFDYAPREAALAEARQWRVALGTHRPVWVAGSTHAGEEDVVLAAHRELLRRHPDALLVLVPRHPPRFATVEAALAATGWTYAVRTERGALPDTAGRSVLLLATLGELECAYAAGDVAFVGGTLVPIGGHNLLEPAAVGRPVLFGPSYTTARAMAQVLIASGGGAVVDDAAMLADRLCRYFDDADLRLRQGRAAADAVAGNRGAAQRIAAIVAPLLRGAGT